MSVKISEANAMTRIYIHEVFEKRLREEGFMCPNDKLLCWYRLQNDVVMQSIFFHSVWRRLPIMLDISYGIHPLFVPPIYMPNVFFTFRTSMEEETFMPQPIRTLGHTFKRCYRDNVLVNVPNGECRGLYTFDSILLPIMDGVQTIMDTHLLYKNRREKCVPVYEKEQHFFPVSSLLMDTAIFVDDQELYPICKLSVEDGLSRCQIRLQRNYGPQQIKATQARIHRLELIRRALFENRREEYLKILEERQRNNLFYVQKKCGITIKGQSKTRGRFCTEDI